MMTNPSSFAGAVVVIAIISLACTDRAAADDPPVPTVLAKRGELILDDNGAKDRGSKSVIELENGIGLKTALGSWQRATPESNV